MELANLNVIEPKNFTEASRILGKKANAKGFDTDSVVYLHSETLSPSRRSSTDKNMVVVGGTAEAPVRIHVESGMNVIEVVSGHAEITCDSPYGNVVYAQEEATVIVKASASRKVSIGGEGDITFKTQSADHRLRDNTPKTTVKVLVAA